MKNSCRKLASLGLALILLLGLAAPALAYSTPDFSDVPSNHWAYESVMKMADAGVIKGTGNGAFSPEMKLSAEMFIVLVGRVVFPDIKAEGADWSGPYVAEAKAKGLLEGTNVTDANLTGEISRYDMAVILAKCVEILKVSTTKADSSKVTDYGDVPNRYTEAVLMAYGSGLIRGDQSGSFNGANSMTRQEAATVMDRLLGLKGGTSQGGGTDPQPTTGPEQPSDATYYLKLVGSVVEEGVLLPGERTIISCIPTPNAEDGERPSYGQDRSGFTYTSSNPDVVQIDSRESGAWSLTALTLGPTTITLIDPNGVSASFDISVLDKREGVGTKNYTVGVRLESQKHNPKGGSYTETTYLYDTPFKLYYTRDGGKTSQLVAEGRTPTEESGTFYADLEVELPEDAFYSNDSGFYVSAEAVVDGQRVVTSDLRTDGRAYITITKENKSIESKFANVPTTLTPPEGEKANFTFKGYVEGGNPTRNIGGITVQLYHKNGTLLGETVSRENGSFSIDFQVDALDGAFDKTAKLYQVKAFGYDGPWFMEITGYMGEGDEKVPRLRSLTDLKAVMEDGTVVKLDGSAGYGDFILRVPIIPSKSN